MNDVLLNLRLKLIEKDLASRISSVDIALQEEQFKNKTKEEKKKIRMEMLRVLQEKEANCKRVKASLDTKAQIDFINKYLESIKIGMPLTFKTDIKEQSKDQALNIQQEDIIEPMSISSSFPSPQNEVGTIMKTLVSETATAIERELYHKMQGIFENEIKEKMKTYENDLRIHYEKMQKSFISKYESNFLTEYKQAIKKMNLIYDEFILLNKSLNLADSLSDTSLFKAKIHEALHLLDKQKNSYGLKYLIYSETLSFIRELYK